MAKIDTSKIQGYADMTAEQKLAALEAYDDETDVGTESEKLKKALTRANAEAADLKKQLRAKQSDEEAANAEREAKFKELQDKYAELEKQNTIRNYAEKYREAGYDDKLALDTAKALADGDLDKVFANNIAFRSSFEQSIRADVTKSTPKPQSGSGKVYKTKDDILKIEDVAERQQAIANNIELFNSEE